MPGLMQMLLIAFISMAAFVDAGKHDGAVSFRRENVSFPRRRKVGLYYAYLGVIIAIVQGGFIGRLTGMFGEWPLAIIGPLLVAVGMAIIAVVGFKPIMAPIAHRAARSTRSGGACKRRRFMR